MSEILREEKISTKEVSRLSPRVTRKFYTDGSNAVSEVFEAANVGSLQRIANSMETIAATLIRIETAMDKPLGTFELQKQVTKLSMRLKSAGLDGDPYSDNRGKRKNGPG